MERCIRWSLGKFIHNWRIKCWFPHSHLLTDWLRIWLPRSADSDIYRSPYDYWHTIYRSFEFSRWRIWHYLQEWVLEWSAHTHFWFRRDWVSDWKWCISRYSARSHLSRRFMSSWLGTWVLRSHSSNLVCVCYRRLRWFVESHHWQFNLVHSGLRDIQCRTIHHDRCSNHSN